MSRPAKLVGAALVVGALIIGGSYVRRAWRSADLTPEGYQLLTPMPTSEGFEPRMLPKTPILHNTSQSGLAVTFGYKVGNVPYSYALDLSFPDSGNAGQATVSTRHASREASAESPVLRRWDEPRKAYAIALQETFTVEPAVPSLCIKAVIGAKTSGYDLQDASLCIAQRDAAGTCHPETLACGLIRP